MGPETESPEPRAAPRAPTDPAAWKGSGSWTLGWIAGLVALTARYLVLPERFLFDERTIVAEASVPGWPRGGAFAVASQVYRPFMELGLPIDVVAAAAFGLATALALRLIPGLGANPRGLLLTAVLAPFWIAFISPAGKDQILAVLVLLSFATPGSGKRNVARGLTVAYGLLVRPYVLLAILAGGAWRLVRPRPRLAWVAVLTVVGVLACVALAAEYGFSLAEYRDRINADRMGSADADTMLPFRVEGATPALTEVYSWFNALWFVATAGSVSPGNWLLPAAGTAYLYATAWMMTRAGQASHARPLAFMQSAYPAFWSLQLLFEPDLGSLARHHAIFSPFALALFHASSGVSTAPVVEAERPRAATDLGGHVDGTND